jgi:hypothetical protein
MKAYCMHCKAMKEMTNEKRVKTSRGSYCMKGNCPSCGTRMAKFVK